MRALVVVLAGSLIASGCAVNSYKIPPDELARLARVPPEGRGEHVRVVQRVGEDDLGPQHPVEAETQIVVFPDVDDEPIAGRPRRWGHGLPASGAGSRPTRGEARPHASSTGSM